MAYFLKSHKSKLKVTVLILIMITMAVMYEGDTIHRPAILRKVSQWSSRAGFGQYWALDETTTSTSTSIEPSSSTAPPLILRRNFQKHYNFGELHEDRRRTLEHVCDRSTHGYYGKSKGSIVAKSLVIDQKHHLVYCPVQKTGSTFLQSLMRRVDRDGVKNVDTRSMMSNKEKDTDLTEFHYMLSSSFKMMFTREPYSRLFSGYVDKLFTVNTLYWKDTGTYIKNNILKPESKRPTKCGHGITFPQFIKYVIESERTGVHTDRHFTPIYEHCRPCQIPYDFIGKMETFANDSLILLNAWNKRYGINITYDDFEVDTALQRAISHTGRLYSMRKDMEQCISFHSGMQKIWMTLQIRGILSKQSRLPFTESEAAGVNRTQLTDAWTKAFKSETDRAATRKQKMEALVEAYRQVPMEDLVKLREVVRPDCELFGYNVSPDYIFNRSDSSYASSSFRYFDIDV
ncbi:carbohydrate sulfotransferase 8-like isoform X1 [Mizuhopecten yessoensis]|uniref:Carbohydrate sulfotransferase n=1 Tax=Mizuhopecten yessoensis TaxID=6573 RepID=A0A210R3C8_MIZYE|nr:carbohydrate sulfotransferase 8-like isoform X1 [Mizuhopecten yessoensis]OWF55452.1 Carbohydrate sulfotransferase 14 [Mizuhopecten yessoensis]